MVVIMSFKRYLFSVGLLAIVCLDVSLVHAQSNGDFWWLNKKLVNSAKNARETNPPSARVINVAPTINEEIRPVTEILDDIPPPVTRRNFFSTTIRPKTTTSTTTLKPPTTKVVRRIRPSRKGSFRFPDEVNVTTAKAPLRNVEYLETNKLESIERSRRPQTFSIDEVRTVETTKAPLRSRKRVRFQGKSTDDDQTGSASEVNLATYKDLSRFLTFS
ncbi:uncharacterized protein LOC134834100 [Culicoides brevitarsis]|uniref:uncharacterized protein LOC134834100 n=1 Tax=Culicoides brevitarsis TaxID=469753 RepID=UPI00307BAA32